MKKCEGACESHFGEVVTVHVKTVSGYDWGEFDYCEAAVEEDRRRGFIVTPSNKRLHLTAYGASLLAFLAGFGICWLAFVR